IHLEARFRDRLIEIPPRRRHGYVGERSELSRAVDARRHQKATTRIANRRQDCGEPFLTVAVVTRRYQSLRGIDADRKGHPGEKAGLLEEGRRPRQPDRIALLKLRESSAHFF